jgi:hypothetical protein
MIKNRFKYKNFNYIITSRLGLNLGDFVVFEETYES